MGNINELVIVPTMPELGYVARFRGLSSASSLALWASALGGDEQGSTVGADIRSASDASGWAREFAKGVGRAEDAYFSSLGETRELTLGIHTGGDQESWLGVTFDVDPQSKYLGENTTVVWKGYPGPQLLSLLYGGRCAGFGLVSTGSGLQLPKAHDWWPTADVPIASSVASSQLPEHGFEAKFRALPTAELLRLLVDAALPDSATSAHGPEYFSAAELKEWARQYFLKIRRLKPLAVSKAEVDPSGVYLGLYGTRSKDCALAVRFDLVEGSIRVENSSLYWQGAPGPAIVHLLNSRPCVDCQPSRSSLMELLEPAVSVEEDEW